MKYLNFNGFDINSQIEFINLSKFLSLINFRGLDDLQGQNSIGQVFKGLEIFFIMSMFDEQ